MRIGVIAPVAHPMPGRDRPWEQIAWHLTEGLVAVGADVTLFATADSITSARLVSVLAAGFERDQAVDPVVGTALHLASAFERAAGFDILLNLSDHLPLTYSRLVRTPMVTTIHRPNFPDSHRVYRAYADTAHYVAISAASRIDGLTYAATIQHGLHLAGTDLVTEPADYLLALGPIGPDSGTELAILLARQTNRPLVLAGEIADEHYFRQHVVAHLGGSDISYRSRPEPAEQARLLGNARALLELGRFVDPFGRKVIESLASGTPVISTPLGPMSELIEPGSTGFLVADLTGAVAAVHRLGEIDRSRCRAAAISRFSLDRTIEQYLDLFDLILDRQQQARNLGQQLLPHREPAQRDWAVLA